MSRVTLLALRAIIALCLMGSLLVQTFLMTAIWFDLETVPLPIRIALIVIFELWIVCLQVVAVCIWRLAGFAASVEVFQTRSFRFVDVVIGAIVVAAVLTATFASILLAGEAAPGVVGLAFGASLVIAGVAFIVVIMRMLLQQATLMRDELAEVV
jgi:hypothetical protein